MIKRIEITTNDSPLDTRGGYIVSEISEDPSQGVVKTIKTRLDSIEEVLGAVRFILRRGEMSLHADPLPALEGGEKIKEAEVNAMVEAEKLI